MKQRYNKPRSVIQLIQMTYIDNVFVGMIRLVYQTAPRQQLQAFQEKTSLRQFGELHTRKGCFIRGWIRHNSDTLKGDTQLLTVELSKHWTSSAYKNLIDLYNRSLPLTNSVFFGRMKKKIYNQALSQTNICKADENRENWQRTRLIAVTHRWHKTCSRSSRWQSLYTQGMIFW